ncbi:MAG: bifunctional metallophosphatase/5'-nucleotidase [Bacteroidales bacterium]|nr:bifunctional metallophosphatase/5'-nucleotidase [Bacteroidales bacterium]
MKTRHLLLLGAALLALSCGHSLKDGEYTLTVLSTNDAHGTWFDSTYIGTGVRKSLMAVNTYVDSVRKADGAQNVVLVEVGDCLQGDNAAYYFNYVDTLSPHLFPRLLQYMGYDAVVWGNHDVETGHKVYDRVQKELTKAGIPFLAGNAIRDDNGKPYFPLYKIVRKGGLKVAVLGYENANIKAWLAEEVWSGMHFESIVSRVQADVDAVRAKEHPDVVIVGVHSGTGEGDGSNPESEGLDVFNCVKGVDWVLCSHDHRPVVQVRDSIGLMNSGSHSRYLACGKMHIQVEGGKVVSKKLEAGLIPVKAEKADPVMRETFRPEYEAVKAFTLKEVGRLNVPLRTRDAYKGMSDYINLIHTICIQCKPAQLSIAAPLTFNGNVKEGTLVFNDLFTIYPFENQLYVITMTGDEIRRYLEASYDRWINTVSKPGEHVLRIIPRDNTRTQQTGWSFYGLSYNFDSIAGLNYTVDVTKPRGERVNITSLADGSAFGEDATYNVAITSYRASGGGFLLDEIGINTDLIDQRVVARYPEIRNLIFERLVKDPTIDREEISDPSLLGTWKFIPEDLAQKGIEADMELLFGKD